MKKLLIGLGVLAVIVTIIAVSVRRKKVAGEGVYAEKVSRGDVVTVVTGTGEIQPRTKVNISSEVYGQIIELPVKEGQDIQKGALLIKIDPEKYRWEVDRLSANVRVSRTAIDSEQVNLKNLEIEQRRAHELHAQEILSASDLERADLAVDTSRIRLKSLSESVAQAEAALSRARDELGKTTIYAPMAGKVTQVNSEVGEQVIVGTTNIPGSVILVISDMSEVLAEVNVDETEVVKLKPGQSAKVTMDAVEKTTYEGVVTEIGNTALKQGDVRVFNVKVLLTNADERLRPGMTSKARIEVARRKDVLRIPVQAVTARERKKLDEERKAAGKKLGGAVAGSVAAGAEEKVGEGKAAADKTAASPAAGSEAMAGAQTEASETTQAAGAGSALASGATGEPSASGAAGETSASAGGSRAGSKSVATNRASGGRAGSAPDVVAESGGEAGSGRPESSQAKGAPGESAAREEGGAGGSQAASTGTGTDRAAGAASDSASDGTPDEREEIEVVYVVEKELVRAVPVKTGASDDTYVEIKEGLALDQTVVKGPYRVLKRIKEGDRVIVKDEREIVEKSAEGGGSGSDND